MPQPLYELSAEDILRMTADDLDKLLQSINAELFRMLPDAEHAYSLAAGFRGRERILSAMKSTTQSQLRALRDLAH